MRDLVYFSFLVRNGTFCEKQDVENSYKKCTRLKKKILLLHYYYCICYLLVRQTNKPTLNFICLSECLSVCLSVCPSVRLSACTPTLLPFCPPLSKGVKMKNCFISCLILFSVSQEVLTSHFGLFWVLKILVFAHS